MTALTRMIAALAPWLAGTIPAQAFVKEAARRIGLTGLHQPGLMKRPRSYLKAVVAANTGRITRVAMHGKAHLATLAPLVAAPRIPSPIISVTVPPPIPYPPS